jgi:hypothetical protein
MAVGDVINAINVSYGSTTTLQPSGSTVYLITNMSMWGSSTVDQVFQLTNGSNTVELWHLHTSYGNAYNPNGTQQAQGSQPVTCRIFISNSWYMQMTFSNNGNNGGAMQCTGVQIR